MKKMNRAVCVAMISAFLANSALAAFIPPGSLSPGDTFHWAFVTSTTRDATSADIGDYNAFVNAAADNSGIAGLISGVTGVGHLGDIVWSAIASTPSVDAVDNVGPLAAPIFRLDGAFLAPNGPGLFDGAIDVPLGVNELGGGLDSLVWTGSLFAGTGTGSLFRLGASVPGAGFSAFSDTRWLEFTPPTPFGGGPLLPLYAVSGELTVVPVPGAFILGVLGLAVASGVIRKRHGYSPVFAPSP